MDHNITLLDKKTLSVSAESINTGRSVDTDMSAVFDAMCDKLENAEADCVQTVDALVQQMTALTGDDDRSYSGPAFTMAS